MLPVAPREQLKAGDKCGIADLDARRRKASRNSKNLLLVKNKRNFRSRDCYLGRKFIGISRKKNRDMFILVLLCVMGSLERIICPAAVLPYASCRGSSCDVPAEKESEEQGVAVPIKEGAFEGAYNNM